MIILIGAAIVFGGNDEPELVAPTDPVPSTVVSEVDPRPLSAQWVEAMNQGDLEGALAILSPEASCDLPAGSLVTCQQHLGYLIAIGTHIETRSCREEPPYQCSYGLTSEFHAALGYPDHSLPATTEIGVDQAGLLVADFFGTIDTSSPYWPSEGGDLWGWMQSEYPEMTIHRTFGPDPYDESAGVAAMEAARRFNSPERIVQQIQLSLDSYASSALRQCATQDGPVECTPLMNFLKAIDAELRLECDAVTTEPGVITCPLTIESGIHQALDSEASTSEAVIEYRGGLTQSLQMEIRFADDPAVHDAFVAYAATVDGLFQEGELIFDGDSGRSLLDAARDFSAQ
ncbi:MAG TPA: hypothetical protein VMS99_04380 [Acidimicrobiia bacterium]|nr:hypothetical protein [Acidimicrobiia bacterium]